MKNLKNLSAFCLLLSVLLTQTFCKKDQNVVPEPTPSKYYRFDDITGGGQTGVVGQPLSNPISVRIVDDKDQGAGGIPVTFSTANGEESNSTNSEGYVEAQWTLGSNPGTQSMTIKFDKGESPGSKTITATAKLRDCIEEPLFFTPSPITYLPPHTNGDQEYNGHGPKMNVNVSVYLDGTRVKAKVYMKAIETQSDWTTAEGTKIVDITPSLPANRKIISILSSDQYTMPTFTDMNHAIDVIVGGSGSLVSKCELIGDSSGKDAGVKTQVTVHFNSIKLLLRETGDCE